MSHPSLSDVLLQVQGEAVAVFKAERPGVSPGELNSLLSSYQAEHIAEANRRWEAAQAAARDTEVLSTSRSKMSVQEKAAFLGKHGLEAYQKLPA